MVQRWLPTDQAAMAEQALERPRSDAPPRGALPLSGRLASLLEREGLVIVPIAAWISFLVVLMPVMLVQDTWLSLVDGRLIATSWLPHVDTMTAWTLGRHWIDQQWGAQLAFYELARYGGLRAVLAVGIGCVAAAFVLAAIAGRTLGGSPRSVAFALMLPMLTTPWLSQVRAQSFALVLFVAVYWLLARDSRRRDRRVLWVLPLLALWANLHGSVALAAGLASLYGLTLCRERAGRAVGLALAIGSPLTLIASPYGLNLIGYYRLMLLHPPLVGFVREWKPASVGLATALFFASAFALSAAWGAHRKSLTGFEQWALPILLVVALTAVRNTTWFAFAATIAAPRMLDAAWPTAITLTPRIRQVNRLLGGTALAAVLLVSAAEFARAPGWLSRGASTTEAGKIARAAGRHGIVLADDEHSDWLLWNEPSLGGRVAYDVRFELFKTNELRQLQLLRDGSHPIWRTCGASARVVTFNGPADEKIALREHVLAPGARTIVRTATLVAVEQPANGVRCGLGSR